VTSHNRPSTVAIARRRQILCTTMLPLKPAAKHLFISGLLISLIGFIWGLFAGSVVAAHPYARKEYVGAHHQMFHSGELLIAVGAVAQMLPLAYPTWTAWLYTVGCWTGPAAYMIIALSGERCYILQPNSPGYEQSLHEAYKDGFFGGLASILLVGLRAPSIVVAVALMLGDAIKASTDAWTTKDT
jgi:hypothetical protein